MEKTEIILAATDKGEAVEKIGNVNLHVNFDEGVVSINGQKIVLDALGKSHNTPLSHNNFNIRMAELENVTMPTDETEAKKREAKVAVFTKLIDTIKKATEKAVIELDKI